MGIEAYATRTPYQSKVSDALTTLQQQVFIDKDYRYSDAEDFQTISEARSYAAEDGTCSVLDIGGISEEIPHLEYEEFRAFLCRAITEEELQEFFGKSQLQVTDIETINENEALWESFSRGESRYLTLYQDGIPKEYYFIGYSFD